MSRLGINLRIRIHYTIKDKMYRKDCILSTIVQKKKSDLGIHDIMNTA